MQQQLKQATSSTPVVLNWGCEKGLLGVQTVNFSDNTKNNTSNGARGTKMIFPSRWGAGFKMN